MTNPADTSPNPTPVPTPQPSPKAPAAIPPRASTPLDKVFSGSRSAIMLVTIALVWLVLAIFAASRVPFPGYLLIGVVGLGMILMVAIYAVAAFYAWAFKRRLGAVAWLSVPVALVVVFVLPWSTWFWTMKVKSASTELTRIVEENGSRPERDTRELSPEQKAGAFTITHVTRLRNGTALSLDHGAGHDTGLLYVAGGSSVRPEDVDAPSWATSKTVTRVTGPWHRYHWHKD